MLQCLLAVSQRAWKRRFPLFVLEFCLGGGYHLSCNVQYVCIRNAAPLCECTQILILLAVISIRLVQTCISLRKTAFSVSAPLRTSDVGFLVFWVLFPSIAVTVNSVFTFPLAFWQLISLWDSLGWFITFSRVYLIQPHSLRKRGKILNSKFLL